MLCWPWSPSGPTSCRRERAHPPPPIRPFFRPLLLLPLRTEPVTLGKVKKTNSTARPLPGFISPFNYLRVVFKSHLHCYFLTTLPDVRRSLLTSCWKHSVFTGASPSPTHSPCHHASFGQGTGERFTPVRSLQMFAAGLRGDAGGAGRHGRCDCRPGRDRTRGAMLTDRW